MFNEQRQAARKVLKVKAMLAMEGEAPAVGRTHDIGSGGMCVTTPNPVKVGATGQVGFDLLLDGKPTAVTARCRSTYCVFSGGEFKVGFQFLNLDLSAMTKLAKFLR